MNYCANRMYYQNKFYLFFLLRQKGTKFISGSYCDNKSKNAVFVGSAEVPPIVRETSLTFRETSRTFGKMFMKFQQFLYEVSGISL